MPGKPVPPWQGWLPWLIVSAVVIPVDHLQGRRRGQQAINWPGLHKLISITLYNDKPYAAVWTFQPLGPARPFCWRPSSPHDRAPLADRIPALRGYTIRQAWLAVVTVMLIVGLAYLMNYSGLAYTLGKGAASVGHLFILFSPFLGWLRCSSREATPRAMRCSAICRWLRRGNCSSIPCCSRPPIPPVASWAR